MSDPFTAAVTLFLVSIPASLVLGMLLVRPERQWLGRRGRTPAC